MGSCFFFAIDLFCRVVYVFHAYTWSVGGRGSLRGRFFVLFCCFFFAIDLFCRVV